MSKKSLMKAGSASDDDDGPLPKRLAIVASANPVDPDRVVKVEVKTEPYDLNEVDDCVSLEVRFLLVFIS